MCKKLDSRLRGNDANRFFQHTPGLSAMFRLLTFLFLFINSLVISSVAHATVDAQLDRDQVSEGDTIALTLRTSGDNSDEPDLSPLQQDFDIVSQSQSSSFSFNNFKQSSTREWRLQLMPKRSGALTIPPITIGSETTPAIPLTINKRDNSSGNNKDSVYVQATLDTDNAYIQQEVILTVKVFLAVPVDNMQLNDVSFDNATFKKLSQTDYQTTQNGIPYNVIEIRYSLFPREAGKLTIPEFIFSARQMGRNQSFFDMQSGGNLVRRLSQPMTLNVKPIPREFTGKTWLPARSLRLKEEWGNDDPSLAQTGKALTRNVVIEANGLLAAQLPALPQPSVDGLQSYPDQPVLADQESANGIRSSREEPSALIPTQPGTITLPEIRVAWWDVDTNTQKEAILGSSQITAVGAALTPPAPVAQSAPQTSINSDANKSGADHSATAAKENVTAQTSTSLLGGNNLLWQCLAAIALIGWIITVYLWRKATAQKSAVSPTNNSADNNANNQQEKAAFKTLRDACRSNNPAAIRQPLIAWASCVWPDKPPLTLDDIASRITIAEFTLLIQQLNAQMYRAQGDSSSFNSERLIALLDNWRQQRSMKKDDANPLPDLY